MFGGVGARLADAVSEKQTMRLGIPLLTPDPDGRIHSSMSVVPQHPFRLTISGAVLLLAAPLTPRFGVGARATRNLSQVHSLSIYRHRNRRRYT